MKNRKRLLVQICLCSLLSVCLVLQLSFSAPKVFAATAVTSPVTVPSSWSGVSAGTAQTGYPYQYARVSVESGSVVINKAVQTAGYLDLYWNNTGSGSNPSTIDLGLVDGGYTLKQGYHYILNLRILGFPMGNPTSTVVVTVSDGVLSRTQSVPAGVLTNFEWEYYPDKNIGISDLQLIIYNSTTAQEFYIYPLKILERSPDQNVIDNQNQNTQQIIDNQNANRQQINNQIQNSTAALQQSIDNQTQAQVNATEQQTSAIGGFFDNLLNGIMSLFIPSTEYFTQFFDDFNTWMEEHFGALYYPIALIVDVLQRLAALPVNQQPSITLPGVTIQGQKLWDETTYKFDFSDGLGLNTIYQLYLTVVDCIIAIGLVNLAKRKMEEIQKGV